MLCCLDSCRRKKQNVCESRKEPNHNDGISKGTCLFFNGEKHDNITEKDKKMDLLLKIVTLVTNNMKSWKIQIFLKEQIKKKKE